MKLMSTICSRRPLWKEWARHWMDVVRYAETYGYEWNYEILDARGAIATI